MRDPHLTRGPDGAFYLAMTDLHIFGDRAGFRETRWQRPQEKYGWGNNRALVLMKSWDLIHWTHSDFRVDLAFPELGDIDCAWAPETTYDPVAGKMMVYFTIRYGNKNAHIYYAYVLMYDVYGARPNNMGFSETKDFATYKDLGHFNESVMRGTNFERPKHGAVSYLTLDELKTVAAHWNVPIDLN